MAFPDGWSHRVPITIESDDIDATLTNWTLVFDQTFDSVLTQANGPLDADGTRASINGGGDIAFSSDEAGTTQVACDIRSWVTNNTPASATCEVAVMVPSVASGADTTIYMWWGASGETQPAVDATYGQYNAYDSNHVGVWDMGQDPSGGANSVLDRTSNQNHGTPAGTMLTEDLVTGGVGGGIEFDGTDDRISLGDEDEFSFTTGSPDGPFTMEALVNATDKTTDNYTVLGKGSDYNNGEYYLDFGNNSLRCRVIDDSESAYVGGTNFENARTWEHVAATYNGGGAWDDVYLYQDGERLSESSSTTGSYTEMENTSNELMIGSLTSAGSDFFDGIIDEVRLSSVERSAAWITANYENQLNTAGFLTWGSITDISAGTDIAVGNVGAIAVAGFDPTVLGATAFTVGNVGDVDIAGYTSVVTAASTWEIGAYIYDSGGGVQVNVGNAGAVGVIGFNPGTLSADTTFTVGNVGEVGIAGFGATVVLSTAIAVLNTGAVAIAGFAASVFQATAIAVGNVGEVVVAGLKANISDGLSAAAGGITRIAMKMATILRR